MDTDPKDVQKTLDEISAVCDLWTDATLSDDGVRATLIGVGIADVVTENELRQLVILTLRQQGGNLQQDYLVEQVTWWITTEAQAAVRRMLRTMILDGSLVVDDYHYREVERKLLPKPKVITNHLGPKVVKPDDPVTTLPDKVEKKNTTPPQSRKGRAVDAVLDVGRHDVLVEQARARKQKARAAAREIAERQPTGEKVKEAARLWKDDVPLEKIAEKLHVDVHWILDWAAKRQWLERSIDDLVKVTEST